jgi:hypothetical protein
MAERTAGWQRNLIKPILGMISLSIKDYELPHFSIMLALCFSSLLTWSLKEGMNKMSSSILLINEFNFKKLCPV